MADEFTIKMVGDRWAKAEKELAKAGQRELRSTLRKIITTETKPARIELRTVTRAALPKKGGLSKWAGKMPALSIHESGPSIGATIKLGKKGHDFKALDRGRIRHPLFGNRDHWYMEGGEAGWWSGAITRLQPQIREAVTVALQKYVDDMGKRIA